MRRQWQGWITGRPGTGTPGMHVGHTASYDILTAIFSAAAATASSPGWQPSAVPAPGTGPSTLGAAPATRHLIGPFVI
ncbi:MAG TPA: hypothetical protein VIV12_30685, partial [Streptosporangiaceae bacterium]